MRIRTIWRTTEEEMRLIKNNLTFTVIVDHESNWTEQANTLDEAIQILRDLVESDGHHVFMNVTKWDFTTYGPHATPKIIVKWCNTQTGKMHTKTIKANDINYTQIALYQHKHLAYLCEHEPDKYGKYKGYLQTFVY